MSEIESFYERREWRELRYRVLTRHGRRCMLCKREPAENRDVHVDHIKSIKLYPELALVESNLQVLCRDCNFGKGWRHSDDFRPIPERPVPLWANEPEMRVRVAMRKGNRIRRAYAALLHRAAKPLSPSDRARLAAAFVKLRQIEQRASGKLQRLA
jgi:hypothetical protein